MCYFQYQFKIPVNDTRMAHFYAKRFSLVRFQSVNFCWYCTPYSTIFGAGIFRLCPIAAAKCIEQRLYELCVRMWDLFLSSLSYCTSLVAVRNCNCNDNCNYINNCKDGLNMSEDKLPALVPLVKKWDMWEWTGFISLGVRRRIELLWRPLWIWVSWSFIKWISWMTEETLALEEGSYCTNLDSLK
jgi:hypothetical protein